MLFENVYNSKNYTISNKILTWRCEVWSQVRRGFCDERNWVGCAGWETPHRHLYCPRNQWEKRAVKSWRLCSYLTASPGLHSVTWTSADGWCPRWTSHIGLPMDTSVPSAMKQFLNVTCFNIIFNYFDIQHFVIRCTLMLQALWFITSLSTMRSTILDRYRGMIFFKTNTNTESQIIFTSFANYNPHKLDIK